MLLVGSFLTDWDLRTSNLFLPVINLGINNPNIQPIITPIVSAHIGVSPTLINVFNITITHVPKLAPSVSL